MATKRYLGLDLSLSPGIASISVKDRIPTLIATASVATSSKDGDVLRAHAVESLVGGFVYANRPFDAVIREGFTSGRNKRATQTVFSAWAAADRGLHIYGYAVDDEISPSSVKKLVTGNGRAEKEEVADGVRSLLRLGDDYKFATDDESDAAAVILAWLIREKIIGEVAA